MKTIMLYLHVLIIFSLLLIIGCADPPEPITVQAAVGEYAYKYKSGEIEVIILRTNMTYQQEIYTNIVSYKSFGIPLYINTNRWSYRGDMDLFFTNAYHFCDGFPDRLLKSPRKFGYRIGTWFPSSKWGDGGIIINDDLHYIFLRIKSRENTDKVFQFFDKKKY